MYYSNNTEIYLTLSGHVGLEKYRYLYFVMTFTVYLLIICFNSAVIFVIITVKRLHEPMYIFIAALLCNALLGTTALYPKLLVDLLSESQIVSYLACTLQSHIIITYSASEIAVLSAMAYDRYVSICKPFQYVTTMKMSTVKKMIFCCWFVPTCETGIALIITYQYKLCQFKLNKIYCNNHAIGKLSCEDITVKIAYGIFLFVIAVFPPVIFICYSYYRILAVCLRGSEDCRKKALQTCIPHLMVFCSFVFSSSFEFICNRIESKIPHIVSMIISVENLIIPPLANPIIYGLKLQEILNRIKGIIWKKKTHATFKTG